jgi:hypothetical protein
MEENDGYVKVDFNDIFWNINVKDTGRKNGKKEDSEPIIKLSWGWNPDEDPKAEKEGWHNNSVTILKSQAQKLKDDLEDIIDSMNAKLFD